MLLPADLERFLLVSASSETATQRALYAIINSLQVYNAAPTFFIPAVVLCGEHV